LCGIFLGCLANNAISIEIGEAVRGLLTFSMLRWVLAASFAGAAVWVLFPGRLEPASKTVFTGTSLHAFAITASLYFVTGIGDKTQVASMAFGARFESFLPVVAGTTIGAVLADVPAVLAGWWARERYASPWPRYAAAALFCAQSALVLANRGSC
jgi:putative Ca2+/H+ antiporter (TMEM165/GDT1 family)